MITQSFKKFTANVVNAGSFYEMRIYYTSKDVLVTKLGFPIKELADLELLIESKKGCIRRASEKEYCKKIKLSYKKDKKAFKEKVIPFEREVFDTMYPHVSDGSRKMLLSE